MNKLSRTMSILCAVYALHSTNGLNAMNIFRSFFDCCICKSENNTEVNDDKGRSSVGVFRFDDEEERSLEMLKSSGIFSKWEREILAFRKHLVASHRNKLKLNILEYTPNALKELPVLVERYCVIKSPKEKVGLLELKTPKYNAFSPILFNVLNEKCGIKIENLENVVFLSRLAITSDVCSFMKDWFQLFLESQESKKYIVFFGLGVEVENEMLLKEIGFKYLGCIKTEDNIKKEYDELAELKRYVWILEKK